LCIRRVEGGLGFLLNQIYSLFTINFSLDFESIL
jgi:hypothetical protein